MTSTKPKSALELLGVPPAPKTGRDRLIAVGIELFYRHGFAAVGIDQILSTAGVTKTTFYKHFESKDDLMVAAVQRRDEWELAAWGRAIKKLAGDELANYPLAMLDVLDVWFNDADYLGCMFTNAAVEFPNPHDPVHQAASAHKRKVRDTWRDIAVAVGAQAQDAETFADCFCALLEGALILRHTQARNDAAKAVRPAVEQLIVAYFPAATKLDKPSTIKKKSAAEIGRPTLSTGY